MVVASVASVAMAQTQPAPETVALTHATVIDGTGAAPRGGSSVPIRGNQAAPSGAGIEDLAGKWIIPG